MDALMLKIETMFDPKVSQTYHFKNQFIVFDSDPRASHNLILLAYALGPQQNSHVNIPLNSYYYGSNMNPCIISPVTVIFTKWTAQGTSVILRF